MQKGAFSCLVYQGIQTVPIQRHRHCIAPMLAAMSQNPHNCRVVRRLPAPQVNGKQIHERSSQKIRCMYNRTPGISRPPLTVV
jgi:hypothetical protein